jgi:hypothetical protein
MLFGEQGQGTLIVELFQAAGIAKDLMLAPPGGDPRGCPSAT